MKKISRISLLFLFLISALTVSSQKYGIEAGYVQPQRYGDEFKSNYFNGIRIGGSYEHTLKHNFSLLTGAMYQLVYSDNTQYYSPSDSVNYKTIGHSIEIPLQVQYSLPVSKNFKFFAFAGPNISIGIAQPQKVTAVISSSTKTYMESIIPENMKPFMRTESATYSQNDLLNSTELYNKTIIQRINFQITFGGGMQFKNYKLKGGYDFGINSINKVDSSKILRQRGWFVSLVYQF